MDDYLRVLRSEFEGEDGSFIIQLRPSCTWDKAAFTRLTAAMQRCCELKSDQELLERWIAHGFWYFSYFVREWTTHPNFPLEHESEYYQRAYIRLDDLAYWYFFGMSPFLPGVQMEPI